MLLEKLTFADDFPINITVGNIVEDPLHYHLDIEFVYVLKGEVQLKNGYCIYHLREGDIFTNSGNEVHSMRALTEDNVIAQIQISIRDLSQYFPNLSKACYRTYSKKTTDKKHDRLRDLLLQILMKYELKGFNYKSECVYLMADVIKHLDKYFNLFVFDKNIVVGFDRGNQLTVDRISRICQYIYQNYANNITLQDLSEMEYLNSFYLSHLIKDFTGMNFRDFLCFARVEMSEIKLLGSDKKISQVAREVGFSTTAYYKKYFTKWFGHSPQEHRSIYLSQVKSDLHPAVFNVLPPNRAIAAVKRAHSNYNSQKEIANVITGVNLDIDVDVYAKSLRKFDRQITVLVTLNDYRSLGPGIFEALGSLAPGKVVLLLDEEERADELRAFRSLLSGCGLPVEVRKGPVPEPASGSAALDSIAYPLYLLRKYSEKDAPAQSEVFLRDTSDSMGRILRGQQALLTGAGIKKPSYFAYAALSRIKGDVIVQGNQYCVVRSTRGETPTYVVLAFNYNDSVHDICRHASEPADVRNAINNFRDELNLSVSFNLKPGAYSVMKYSMSRENNIFAYLSALDFQSETIDRFCAPGNFLSGWPMLETYQEDVRTVLNVNFSIKGPGFQIAVIQSQSAAPYVPRETSDSAR